MWLRLTFLEELATEECPSFFLSRTPFLFFSSIIITKDNTGALAVRPLCQGLQFTLSQGSLVFSLVRVWMIIQAPAYLEVLFLYVPSFLHLPQCLFLMSQVFCSLAIDRQEAYCWTTETPWDPSSDSPTPFFSRLGGSWCPLHLQLPF